jgi:glycosyltransferase involved in cell wall biosynthesis
MRILIITDSYPPEVRSAAQLMAELSEGLGALGHEVCVATTMPAYNLPPELKAESVPSREIINGVKVVRVTTPAHHRVNYVIRGLNQLLLPRIFVNFIKKELTGPFEVVVVHSPPLSLALAASKVAKYYRAKFIANIHDIFPQNGIDLVSWWQKVFVWLFFKPMELLVYRRADKLVVPSENHAIYLQNKNNISKNKLQVISHWIDEKPFEVVLPVNRFRKRWGLENSFVFCFAGVMGPSQNLNIVLDVAEKFNSNEEVKFLFVGDGTDRPNLESRVKISGLKNVIFKPFVSALEYPELIKEMNVGIITLTSKNTTPAVPAKLMGYLAASRPVVLAVNKESDALRIVIEAKCVFVAISNDSQAVLNIFNQAYNYKDYLEELGVNGLRYLKEHFTKQEILKDWDRLVHNL